MAILNIFKKKVKSKKIIKKVIKKSTKKIVKNKSKKKIIKKVKSKKSTIKKGIKPKIPEIEKMNDEKAYKLLKSSGIPVTKYFFCKREKDIQLIKKVGFPSLMKVSSQKVIEPIELRIESGDNIEESFNRLIKTKHADSVLVQKELTGLKILIGVKSDSQFGHILSASLGGMYKEILKDIVFRISPISASDAESMIRELKGYEILEKNSVKLDKLYKILNNFSKIGIKLKLNQINVTLICNKDGCWVIDAKIIK